MADKRIFHANGKWIVDLGPEDVANPDCYFRFGSKQTAVRFAGLVDGGMEPDQAIHELDRRRSGTAPDTSLYLGTKRRSWLQAQGGIQPTIQRMIDEEIEK